MSPLPHFQVELFQLGHQLYLFAGMGKNPHDGRAADPAAQAILYDPNETAIIARVLPMSVPLGSRSTLEIMECVKKSGVVTSHVRHRVGDSGALGCASLPLQPQSGGLTPDFLTLSNS